MKCHNGRKWLKWVLVFIVVEIFCWKQTIGGHVERPEREALRVVRPFRSDVYGRPITFWLMSNIGPGGACVLKRANPQTIHPECGVKNVELVMSKLWESRL
jgi:hypothetical protein